MKLNDLLDPDGLSAAIAAKHVKVQYHRSEPLAILNYTQACMWERAWTPVTRQCRGLIYHTQTGEIVARPFAKFFNYGEPEAPAVDLFAPVVVTDKLDGSLGILYREPNSGLWSIATRGAFHSEQAEHATAIYRERYADKLPEYKRFTLLFEIVYPENRIVLHYGDTDTLFGLGSIEIETGKWFNPTATWPWRRAVTMDHRTFAEALTAPPRPNAEGLVVYFPETGDRLKLKQADYVALHRVMTNTSPRRLWEHLAVQACKRHIDKPKLWASKLGIDPARAESILAAGEDWREKMLAGVPDEFFAWCRAALADIEADVAAIRDEVLTTVAALPDGATRKEIAARLGFVAHPAAVFNVLDGKEIDTYCWKAAYPTADRGWLSRSEDVA